MKRIFQKHSEPSEDALPDPNCRRRTGICWLVALTVSFALTSCSRPTDPNTVVLLIENSPTNLDPRIGTDAQSERIGMLLFDSVLRRDPHFNVAPSLATRWEIPDPRTYIFHLRSGVRFHDGRPLTARDVKWTFDSLMNGTVRSPRAATYQHVERIDAPDDSTVIFHLKEPDASLLWNLTDGNVGIVPYGSGPDFSQHLVGSGPFRFVSQQLDKEVVVERNPNYWDPARLPKIERVRFAVVPDANTRALELRKGSGDIAINAFAPDTVFALRSDHNLEVEQAAGSIYQYLAFNLRDPTLKDVRVRRAIAHAVDRAPMIHFLWRDQAVLASSILPPQSWAYDGHVTQYDFDPALAAKLLDEAGYRPGPDGIRFHLLMKCSNVEESTRLLAAVLQQQLRAVGIALDIRSLEFGTFYADVVKGAFQVFSLRWIGGNQDPDIFDAVFSSRSFPPRRYNRGYYSNPEVDSLIDQAEAEIDQGKRA
ncbi:MAG TPA: ABC transporter substrate-binding protein, partial [Candidatus Binataceae bacterium]|nr:ABC transporter substrate-binding protein [Candidatus Binataceae bacterium]